MFSPNLSNFVSPGDVFVLRDTINKEKDTPPDNTRIIRFQRPAIVVSTGFKICTVIPLTTKENSPEISYPIKVSSDVNSRALFSQITTVDNFRLGKKLGVIDPIVFKDLVNVYTNYILGKPKIYLSRSIAIPTYGMDMIAFDNFAYYRDNSNHERIILSIGNGTSTYYLNTVEPKPMEFPVPENEPKTTVHGVIGKDIELSSIHFLSKEYRETTWTCIGYETYECNRELISDTINEIFGITPVKLVPDKMDTIMEYHLASTISRAFKTSLYLQAFDFIMNSDLEELFSDKIKANPFLTENCNSRDIDMVINTMRELHAYRVNVLDCSIEQLEWMNTKYASKFYPMAMRYADTLVSTELGYTLDINPSMYPNLSYKEENLIWLATYINNELGELNKKARISATRKANRKISKTKSKRK